MNLFHEIDHAEQLRMIERMPHDCMKPLPATVGIQELEQCREQLPRNESFE
ncbi:MAG: hypothetical protein Q7T96_10230 [Methylobacter sp.]|nr:hypothetical protein [Methylobacter sp.]